MEILLSPHLQENLTEIMRTSYNIYSSVGFIGFCVIYTNKKNIQANLLLFEGVNGENLSKNGQKPDIAGSYSLNTSDHHILSDLMSKALPSNKGRFKYIAYNDNSMHHIEN
jgi:hypothetical protein